MAKSNKSKRGKNSIASQISKIKAGKAKAVAKKGYGKNKNVRYKRKIAKNTYLYVVKGR